MAVVVPRRSDPVFPARVARLFAPNRHAAKRFIEHFAADIGNADTRRAHVRAILRFPSWCEARNLTEIVHVEPVQVAAFIEQLGSTLAKPAPPDQPARAFGPSFNHMVDNQTGVAYIQPHV
jgi:hypothetical protein